MPRARSTPQVPRPAPLKRARKGTHRSGDGALPVAAPIPGRPPRADRAADTLLTVRVTREELAAYHDAAGRSGESLSAWVLRLMDAAVTNPSGAG